MSKILIDVKDLLVSRTTKKLTKGVKGKEGCLQLNDSLIFCHKVYLIVLHRGSGQGLYVRKALHHLWDIYRVTKVVEGFHLGYSLLFSTCVFSHYFNEYKAEDDKPKGIKSFMNPWRLSSLQWKSSQSCSVTSLDIPASKPPKLYAA